MNNLRCICAIFLASAFQFAAPPASAQPSGLGLEWSKKPVEGNVETVKVVVRNGTVWVAGNVVKDPIPGVVFNSTADVFVSRISALGEILWTTRLAGSKADIARALTVDDAGNAWVGGATISQDFPLKNAYQSVFPFPEPLPPGPLPGSFPIGFLTKLDPQGKIVYSTLLGGGGDAGVLAIAVDASGSATVSGNTSATNFPTTDTAPIRTFTKTPFGSPSFAFVTRFSPAGDALVYSTLLGGPRRFCLGGSNCLSALATTYANGIALDATGNAWVAGMTTAVDFPVTPDALQSTVNWNFPPGWKVFLTKVNSSGTAFPYSTYLGGSFPGSDYPTGIALDAGGNVVLAGVTDSRDFPVTEGSNDSGAQRGFLSILSADGSKMNYSTYIDPVAAFQLAPDRTIWLTGTAGPDYLASFDTLTHKMRFRRALPPAISGSSIAADNLKAYLAGGASGLLTKLDTSVDGPPAFVGIGSAAGGPYRNSVSPGELVTLFGINLGPANPVYAKLDPDGKVSPEIGGVKVYFAGIIAPLLYADSRQINAVVPFGVGKNADPSLQLVHDDRLAATTILRTVAAQPEAFVPVLNQDGSINSYTKPARPGEILVFWATGCGDMSPRPADGEITGSNPPAPLSNTIVELDGQQLEILYAGAAPGMVAGAMQFNVRLPMQFSYQSQLVLKNGNYTSAPVRIAFAPSLH